MSADLETLIKHLREGTGRVELDLPPTQSSGSIEVAARLARERRMAIGQGVRAAHLYVAPEFGKSLSVRVTEGESRALMDAGATWVGPDVYAPKPLRSHPTWMLEHLSLHEFRAHRSTELRFSRLTMLVGDNASGKTSVLDALALQGALRSPLDDVLRGAWSIPNLLRRGASSNRITLVSSGIRGAEAWTSTLHLIQAEEQKYTVDALAQVGQSKHVANARQGTHTAAIGIRFAQSPVLRRCTACARSGSQLPSIVTIRRFVSSRTAPIPRSCSRR